MRKPRLFLLTGREKIIRIKSIRVTDKEKKSTIKKEKLKFSGNLGKREKGLKQIWQE